jgi:hypothetical protein
MAAGYGAHLIAGVVCLALAVFDPRAAGQLVLQNSNRLLVVYAETIEWNRDDRLLRLNPPVCELSPLGWISWGFGC